MKRLFTFLLALAILLSLAACGDDPNAGMYNAVSCEVMGYEMDCAGDWL